VPAIESNRFRDDETLGKVGDTWMKGHHGNVILERAPAGTTKKQVRDAILELSGRLHRYRNSAKRVVDAAVEMVGGQVVKAEEEFALPDVVRQAMEEVSASPVEGWSDDAVRAAYRAENDCSWWETHRVPAHARVRQAREWCERWRPTKKVG
jgi:hypothetical protein